MGGAILNWSGADIAKGKALSPWRHGTRTLILKGIALKPAIRKIRIFIPIHRLLRGQMKQKLLLTTSGAAILILIAGILVWRNLKPNSDERDDETKRPAIQKTHSTDLGAGKAAQIRPATPTPSNESKPIVRSTKEEILESVHQSSITYDHKELPAIQKYLLDADPEIREAARNGMIVLGDASAGPMLRDASKLAPTPHEAVAMLEAADYVELPSGTLNLKKRAMTKSKRPPSRPRPQDGQAPE